MDTEYETKIAKLKSKIQSFPDFPKKGILFWDIFSAIADGPTCQLLNSLLIETVLKKFPDIDAVVGLESRGFLFAFSLAAALNIGCIPVRKKGKLPGEVVSHKYDLEYGSDILEIQKGVIRPGLKCLIVDDLIATGGSITAAVTLLKSCEADVSGCLVVIELEGLNGRRNIPDGVPVHSLIKSKMIVDDVIATGGSITAAVTLLKSCEADVSGCLVVIELEGLNGRSNIPDGVPVHSLIKYD